MVPKHQPVHVDHVSSAVATRILTQTNNFLTRKPRFFAGDILVIFMFLKIDSNFATWVCRKIMFPLNLLAC
jgi:hypothetical protein